jgi:hypothetical protein
VLLYQAIGSQLLFASAALLFVIASNAIIKAHKQVNSVATL